MPYAANGVIAEDKFEGAIKITSEQYAAGLEGMCNGLVVTIDDGFKVGPPAPVEAPPTPEPTPEEVALAVKMERDRLLGNATLRMAPLQDAVDLGAATAEEIASLNQWKLYRIALNRVEQQPGYPQQIDWPQAPSH